MLPVDLEQRWCFERTTREKFWVLLAEDDMVYLQRQDGTQKHVPYPDFLAHFSMLEESRTGEEAV